MAPRVACVADAAGLFKVWNYAPRGQPRERLQPRHVDAVATSPRLSISFFSCIIPNARIQKMMASKPTAVPVRTRRRLRRGCWGGGAAVAPAEGKTSPCAFIFEIAFVDFLSRAPPAEPLVRGAVRPQRFEMLGRCRCDRSCPDVGPFNKASVNSLARRDGTPLGAQTCGRPSSTRAGTVQSLSQKYFAMASLRVNVRVDGQWAFEALLKALASAPRVEALAVRNCGAANMRALADALLRNPPALAAIWELDLSRDVSGEPSKSWVSSIFSWIAQPDAVDDRFDQKWQLGVEGAEELRRLLPHLKNLTRLVLKCKSLTCGLRTDHKRALSRSFETSFETPPFFRAPSLRDPWLVVLIGHTHHSLMSFVAPSHLDGHCLENLFAGGGLTFETTALERRGRGLSGLGWGGAPT